MMLMTGKESDRKKLEKEHSKMLRQFSEDCVFEWNRWFVNLYYGDEGIEESYKGYE